MSYPDSRWIRRGLFLLLGAGSVLLLVALGGIVRLLLISALVAYLADPLVRKLQARGMQRTTAVGLVFFLLTVLVVSGGLVLLPHTLAQLKDIQTGFPADQFSAIIDRVERWVQEISHSFGIEANSLRAQLEELPQRWVGQLPQALPGLMGMLANLTLIPFFSFFLLKDGPSIRKGLINAVPNRYFELTLSILHKMDLQLGGYLRGQFIAALVVAVLATIVLYLFDVPYYLLIGVIAGLANMIPYLGPIAGALLAIIVSMLTQGTIGHAAGLLVAFVVIQQIDNLVIQPLVLSRNVALSPLMILLSVLVGGTLFGFVGLLLAVPATAILKVTIYETVTTLRRYRFG